MSPSENELRNALHRGEGQPLDVDRITAAGAARRAQRRTRFATVTASVVLVAAAITGTAVLNRDDSSSPPSAAQQRENDGAAASAPGVPPAPAASSSEAPSASSSPAPTSDAAGGTTGELTCPTSFPRRMLPGGGSPGQFGADGLLFERTPIAITVCAYSGTGTVTGTTTLTGRDATALRTSLESASRTPGSCPTAPRTPTRDLAFVAVDAQGRTLRTVTSTLGASDCLNRTSNGTAVRYGWTPPQSLADRLALLGVSVEPRISPSGKNIGTPTR